jgi:pyruvate,orthophosphate dikinase
VPVGDTLPILTDDAWAVLHHLRLRGFRPATGGGAEQELLASDLVAIKGSNLVLSPPGRTAHARWARLPEESEGYAAAKQFYDAFLPRNVELLRICTAWQLGPGNIPNDHSDASYDWAVLDRLDRLDGRIAALLAPLSKAVPRFADYRGRLTEALEKIDGDRRWLAAPQCDSYHTVWMQMHEDILSALGVNRADEAQPE